MLKKHWHKIFIILLIFLTIGAAWHMKNRQQQERAVKKDISNGKLTKSELKTNGIIVLCYHRVASSGGIFDLTKLLSNNSQLHEYSVSLAELKSQINYLKKHKVQIISADQMRQLIQSGQPLKQQYAVITFDDFDSTVYYNASPFLEKEKIPYTIFIVTALTGKYDNGTKLASWKQVKELQKNPLVTLGLHTNNMHYLINNKSAVISQASPKTFQKDFKKSVKTLYRRTGVKSNYFAYPYGESNQQVESYLHKEKMITFSLDNGIINEYSDLNQSLPRTMVDNQSWKKIVTKWVR
ncbi:polysaccharide deacetylase family protein [Streptococcus caballi]|uniref:polysaccharide deacetylase family protein n=1 Tax=Streptococcus caballi TaxID=439220 RepID=UPI0003686A94|nr:polysaccharide deacetylase family protein [Streptococcus caballi]